MECQLQCNIYLLELARQMLTLGLAEAHSISSEVKLDCPTRFAIARKRSICVFRYKLKFPEQVEDRAVPK